MDLKDYRQIQVKNEKNRYTEEFKDAVRQLIKEGNNYKQIADLFSIDSINSGYRQLIWKLQREVFDSVNVKQLKANNTSTEDTAKVSESSVSSKSDKVILSAMEKSHKEVKKINSSKAFDEFKKEHSSETQAGVAPNAKEIVDILLKDAKTLTSEPKSTEKISPSQDVLSLISSLDVQIYNLTKILEAKKMEVSLLESNLETVKAIKEKLAGGF